MADIISSFLNNLFGLWSNSAKEYQIIGGIASYVFFIILYCSFFWNFHKPVSKKEISIFNFQKYIDYDNKIIGRLIIVVLFIIEYFIILPVLLLIWFLIFGIFLFMMSKNQEPFKVLLISASAIIAIRIIAYAQEDLSRNIAKILPFTLLAVFILEPSFLSLEEFLTKVSQIPSLINNSFTIILFVFVTEFILRIFYIIPRAIKSLKSPQEYAAKKSSKKSDKI
jgi:hypothetical protein